MANPPCRGSCARQHTATGAMGTVLLIDDSKFLRRMAELAISRSGHAVISAADGEEGLRLAREKKPNVVVLDIMLPKISGMELLRALKQDPHTAGIPVIVMSSLPKTNEAKLKQSGAVAYVEKSKLGIDAGAKDLIRTIEAALTGATATT